MKQTFNVSFYQARRRAGYSQGRLAFKVGVSRSMITRIENGRRAPNIWDAIRIARVLHAPVETLFELKKEEDHS